MLKKIIAILVILLIAGFIFAKVKFKKVASSDFCLLYTSPSPRDRG